MVLLDICVASGLTYSILGNVYEYIKYKDLIDNDIQELQGETKVLRVCDYKNTFRHPTYANMGSPGFMIPLGGGSYEELRKIYCLLRNKENTIFIKNDEVSNTMKYGISYINTNEDLTALYKKYGIDTTSFPVRFPLKIYETTITEPLYHNHYYFDLKRSKVYNRTLVKNRKPFTFVILGCSLTVLAFSWMNYRHTKQSKFYEIEYPMFHPYRYDPKSPKFIKK